MNLSDLREALHDVLSECGPEGRPRLYRILRKMAEAADGGIVKSDRSRANQQADALDCYRYLCNTFLRRWIERVAVAR